MLQLTLTNSHKVRLFDDTVDTNVYPDYDGELIYDNETKYHVEDYQATIFNRLAFGIANVRQMTKEDAYAQSIKEGNYVDFASTALNFLGFDIIGTEYSVHNLINKVKEIINNRE